MATRNKWRNQFVTIDSASLFHNRVRELLAADTMFRNFKCYQEVNVADLIEGYEHYNHHFDWYIEELNLIVELHGQQHYKVVNYGSINMKQAERSFYSLQDRDNTKKTAAIQAGYRYLEIPYTEYRRLDQEYLRHLVLETEY